MDTNKNKYQGQQKFKPYALTSRDFESLARSTITPEMASAPFVDLYRVDDIEGATTVGHSLKDGRRFSGIVFQYYTLEGIKRASRLRRDYPDLAVQTDGSRKQEGKYLSAPGRGNLLYFPMIVHFSLYAEWVMDSNIPIVFVEGEKKALALMRIALENLSDGKPLFIVIGLSGVWNWKGTIGKTTTADGERVDEKGIIGDFYQIPFEKRKVLIFYDANVRTNESVKAARSQFSYALRDEFSAQVFFAEMPEDAEANSLNGPDDLAFARGDQDVLDCIERARAAFKPAQPKRETTKERAERGAARRLLTQAVAKASMPPDAEAMAKNLLGVKMWRKLAHLWAQAGKLESSERDLLFTLHALAEGEDFIEFYNIDLFKLLYPFTGHETQDFINRKIRERFEALAKVEGACKVQFVERRPGQKINGENVPSFVRLLSFEHIKRIEDLAITDSQYARGKQAAFERAIEVFVREKTNTPFTRPEPKKKKNIYRQIEDGRKRTEGNLRKMLERMKKENYEDWAMAQEVVKALKNSIPRELMESGEFKTVLLTELVGEDTHHDLLHDVCPSANSPTVEAEIEPAENLQIRGEEKLTSKSPQVSVDSTNDHADFQKTCKESAENLQQEQASPALNAGGTDLTGIKINSPNLFEEIVEDMLDSILSKESKLIE